MNYVAIGSNNPKRCWKDSKYGAWIYRHGWMSEETVVEQTQDGMARCGESRKG